MQLATEPTSLDQKHVSDDAVAHMIATSVTLCYVAAGGGRTYGRPWIFHVQMLLACGPLTFALAVNGSPFYIGMALLNVLFFFSLKHISTSLQTIFVRALIAREREAALANQFDTALNNMPHGLAMFRADGRLAVVNCRFSKMMNLSDHLCSEAPTYRTSARPASQPERCRRRAPASFWQEVDQSRASDIITTDPDFSKNRSLSRRSSRWPTAAPSCCWRTSPSAATRRRGSAIWRRYDELTDLPNRVNFRDEIGLFWRPARDSCRAAVRRPRPVQGGQRHARPRCGDQLLCGSPSGCARCCAARIRGALRRRRVRGVPAEHPFAPTTPPALPGASSIA